MTFRGKASRWGAVALTTAMLAGGTLVFSQSARAQQPQSVPAARFFGSVRTSAGAPIVSGLVSTGAQSGVAGSGAQGTAGSIPTGGGVSAFIGGINCGIGSIDNQGTYFVDIQSAPGCTTPGASVSFTVQGQAANETGRLPDIQGSAVRLNLTIRAQATAAPVATRAAAPPSPPAVPTRAATVAATPTRAATVAPTVAAATPTRAATVAATPTRAATVAPAATTRPVSQGVAQAPAKGPVTAQGPAKAAPAAQAPAKGPVTAQAPAYAAAPAKAASGPVTAQAPAYAAAPVSAAAAPRATTAQAPATAPRLPSTGNGGLLGQQSTSNGSAAWALATIVLASLGLGVSGLVAYRRSR